MIKLQRLSTGGLEKAAALVLPCLPGATLFTVALALYVRTLAPSVYGFDSAELATGVYTLGIIHPPGYPLYILLGRLFMLLPTGDVAYRLNLMSAFFAALTVWLVYRLAARLLHNRLAAWSGAILLAIAHPFWQMATLAEVYTLHTALLALLLNLLLAWRETGRFGWLILATFVLGLSLTNHTSGLLYAPAFLWLAVSGSGWRWVYLRRLPILAAVFLAGLLPYTYLPLRVAAAPTLDYVSAYYAVDLTTLSGIYWMASAQAYHMFAFGYSLPETVAEAMVFLQTLWRATFGAGAILGLAGVIALLRTRRAEALALLYIFLANALFYINYRVIDKDTMFLPAYLAWAVFTAAGFDLANRLLDRIGLQTVSLRRLAPALLLVLFLPGLLSNSRYLDMSAAYAPRQLAAGIFSTVPRNTLIFAPWSAAVVLEYYHLVQHERPDVEIFNRSRWEVARFDHYRRQGLEHAEILAILTREMAGYLQGQLAHRPVYAVAYDRDLAQYLLYEPVDELFVLRPRP